MKTVLVTGGAGYIGSHTVVELLENDYEVIVLDNFSNSRREVINFINNISKKEFIVFDGDCRDNLDYIFNIYKIDGIIHFAALKSVGESTEMPLEYYDNNVKSLINILKYCEKYDVKSFVFSSSCSLYGNLIELPADENSPLSEPESPYANTKLMGETILKDFSKVSKTKIISLRYFNPVGAHESGLLGELPINKPNNIIPVICNSVDNNVEMTVFGGDYDTRDGSCIRDYVHVSDIANAHLLSLEYLDKEESLKYDVYNLGLGTGNRFEKEGLTVLEIIKSFESVNDVKVKYKIGDRRSGDVIKIYSNSSKSRKIGWRPKRDLKEMVSSSWKWYKNQKILFK
jgi:UDP-glucose 4-epimerase